MSEQQRWAVMCSMTAGWGVVRPENAYRDDGLLACTEWESLHDTWAEAMQEADRMARTVTVGLAREWAQTAINTPNNFPKGRAAAEVIQSLPDKWIDAEKLREVLVRWESEPLTSETAPWMVAQLRELLPADMAAAWPALLAHARRKDNP